jgi:hypothetical protein
LAIYVFRPFILLFKALNSVSIVLIPTKNIDESVKLTFPLAKSSRTTPLAQAKSSYSDLALYLEAIPIMLQTKTIKSRIIATTAGHLRSHSE